MTTRIRQRGHRDFIRATKNPFMTRADRTLIVLCTHHKTGGLWFRQVLLSIVHRYGLRSQSGRIVPIRPGTDFVFARAETFANECLEDRSFRGIHVIRDPRDMVVSGYEYHRRTDEPWFLNPDPRFGGMSYQEFLHSVDEHDGLMAEIAWIARNSGAAMGAWHYGQPEFLELRYEDAFADEQGVFEQLFRWLRLNDTALRIGMEAVDQLSLKRGGAVLDHARSGVPGEWRERFAPEHVDRFKELTGDLVIRLGYETGPDW
jgi:hypothetical protein